MDSCNTDRAALPETERALRESEERFRIMADGIPQIIWVHDATGRLQFINRAYTEFFGVTLDEVHSTGWQALVHPDDEEAYIAPFLAATREHTEYCAEARVCNGKGEWRWIESRGRPRFSETGEFLGIAGSSLDITERKRAEEALLQSEERFSVALSHAKTVVFTQDRDLRYTWYYNANPGFDGVQVLDKTDAELLPHGEAQMLTDIKREVIRAGKGKRAEVSLSINGVVAYYDMIVEPTTDASGAVTGIICSAAEITERKKAEDALRESEERYRQVVENTTAIILRLDTQARITFANSHALEFFGYSAKELIGRHALGTIVPERETSGRDLALLVDEITEDPERFHSNVNENMRKNGERIWLEWTNSGIYNSGGALTGFLSVGIDITDKVLAQQELDRAESEKLEFYRRTILAATEDKLLIAEPGQIERIAGPAVATWKLRSPDDLRAIRHAAEDAARSAGIDQSRRGGFAVAVGEAISNAVKHAAEAEVSIHRTDGALIVMVSDNGKGIPGMAMPDIALRPGYSTAGTLGMGYKMMLQFADRVCLATGSEGTTVAVVMEMSPLERSAAEVAAKIPAAGGKP